MKTPYTVRIITALVIAASIIGCEIHPRTIREYRVGPGGVPTVTNVTEEQYWKEQVDQRIAAELARKKPESHETWREYYQWWYSVLRRKSKAPFKSAQFKTSEDMVNYIKEKRRAKGLPTYED